MKYFINDTEVSELHFDTALSETIADFVYDNYEENRDELIDRIYDETYSSISNCGEATVDGTKFSIACIDK